MYLKLNDEERASSRNADLIDALLLNDFSNEIFAIQIEKQSPNSVIATFTRKGTKETFKTNLGLPVEDNGVWVKAEPHLTFFGILHQHSAAYFPRLYVKSNELIWFLNHGLAGIVNND